MRVVVVSLHLDQEKIRKFSLYQLLIASLTNATRTFEVTFVDNQLPNGVGSNLGGTGTTAGTKIGDGITRRAVINYDPTLNHHQSVKQKIVITSENTPCIVQEEDIPLNIGIFAKTSVPGYVFSYEWQRTLDPDGTWTTVTNGVRSETIQKK